MNQQEITRRLKGKGGALITRQLLRDLKSFNPLRRAKARRHLKAVR